MKKVSGLALCMAVIQINAQTIEIFGGENWSKNVWTPNYSLLNSKSFEKGITAGFLITASKNEKASFISKIQPGLALEFNQFDVYAYRAINYEASTSSRATIQRLSVTVPFKYDLGGHVLNRLQFAVSAGPRYNVLLNEEYSEWDDATGLTKFTDLSMNIGIEVLYQLGATKRGNPISRNFSAITLRFNRTLDLGTSFESGLGSAKMEQYHLTLGLQFSSSKEKIKRYGTKAVFEDAIN